MNVHTLISAEYNLKVKFKLRITLKLRLKFKPKLTDLSGRLSKLITKAGVHLAIELTHMLRSRGTDSVIL